MSPTGSILVGGGTGFIGKSLCNLLKQKGYGTTVISRMPGVQRVSWNELQQLGLPKNTRAVVNLAGQNVMDVTRRWTAGFKQNIIHSRVNTTKTLAALIDKSEEKPPVFIVISGVGAYKPDNSYEYTEDSCVKPYDFFSELCKDWEEAAQFQDTETKRKCRIVKIRSGVVLGRDGGMIKQLYLPFFLGLGGPVGDGSQFLPWIHIDDLINLIIFAIENPLVEGVLNGVAEKPCTNMQFTKAFAKALRRPALIPIPSFVFNALLDKERAVMLTEGQKVIPKKTLSLGFRYKYPDIETACNEIVNK
ncbi:epimerase family protein SDR39U1 [Diorhabda sublineata]|uniref:epimerase family protein SDR39U1 n=1 Tax=Diorhabda sublineata TaxID=1163346 RepID=UPI0024E0589C|nr:epimerase family protein SDR39U1 [Diorhabda sublineata]